VARLRGGGGRDVRLLVQGDSLGPGMERMLLAAWGLALRGHEVRWLGRNAPRAAASPEARLVRDHHEPDRRGADIVIGSDRALGAAALSGWRAGAHGMVAALDPARRKAWSPLERWCWSSLDSRAMVEETARDLASAPASALEPERLESWSPEAPPEAPEIAHPDVDRLERACERSLARRRGEGLSPAVFLDRDGTLVVEKGYLADPDDIELIPGVPEALYALRQAGYPIVVISNQSGVGRGLFPLSSVHRAMGRLRNLLRPYGVEIDAVHFCPHLPDSGCGCRKPGIELLERAARDLRLSLRQSVMIGDKLLDIRTGHRARALSILVRTGYGRDEERSLGGAGIEARPDHAFDDLAAAVSWILARERVGRWE